MDGAINVWSPSSNEDECHLLTIKGLENTCVRSPIGVLRNGYHLVTCTYNEDNGIIAMWDSTDSRLVFKMDSNLGHVVSLRVLVSDNEAEDETSVNIALGLTTGYVILNFEYANMSALDMISLRNGILLVMTSPSDEDAHNIDLLIRAPYQWSWDSKLYLWNTDTGELLQKQRVEGCPTSCMAFSHDKTTIGVGSIHQGVTGYKIKIQGSK